MLRCPILYSSSEGVPLSGLVRKNIYSIGYKVQFTLLNIFNEEQDQRQAFSLMNLYYN